MADLLPSARGWGNPDTDSYRRDHIVTIKVQGVALAVRRELAGLFTGFLNELCSTTGYRLDVAVDDWGYANRCIRGTGPGTGRPCVKSNHSWGLAIDINALGNPLTRNGVVITDMPALTGRIAQKWGLRWGANYSGSTRDAMHFEFMGSPADVAKYPLGGATAPPPPPSPANREPQRRIIVVKNWVHSMQTPNGGMLHLQADGGIITANDGLDGPDAVYYGSIPGIGGLPLGSKVLMLFPHGPNGGYKIEVIHPSTAVTFYHFPATS